jgi:hypothetical protein
MSALQVYGEDDLSELFYIPLSIQDFQELEQLQILMQANHLLQRKNECHYCWGESYFAKKFYDHIHAHPVVPKVYAWLWKSCYVMKTKVFACLLLSDRLNTRDLLKRRHWNVTDDSHCVFCPSRAYEDRFAFILSLQFQ